jgi:hypothetical protein
MAFLSEQRMVKRAHVPKVRYFSFMTIGFISMFVGANIVHGILKPDLTIPDTRTSQEKAAESKE